MYMVLNGPLKGKEKVFTILNITQYLQRFLKLVFKSHLYRNKDVSFKCLINTEYQWA